jgi:phage/plasmid-like protein (TIGR03299 family)
MSHELEIVNGEASMAYAGSVPWHGLGVQVSNDLAPAEMMAAANVDWKVEKLPSFVNINGKQVPTGQESLVRTSDNHVLTNVGPGWKPVQNDEAFAFFDEFVSAGEMEMHTAGSLKNGQIVWALAKVSESFEVFKGDQVDSYLLFSNPHVYGKSVNVRFTPIRVVCNNTLSMALNNKEDNFYKMGHRTTFDPNIVKQTLGLAHEKFAKYEEMATFLGSKRFTPESLIQYYDEVFPLTSNKKGRDELTAETLSRPAKQAFEVLDAQPGAEFAEGTWWQAFNSVTYMTDHLQGRNAENRLHSQWFGINQARKVVAAEKAVEYAMAT